MYELELPTNLIPISERLNYSCDADEEYHVLTRCHPVSDKAELEETFTVAIIAHPHSGEMEVFNAVITSQQNPEETVVHYLIECRAFQTARNCFLGPLGRIGRNLSTLLATKEAIKPLFKYIHATG